jgi:hypothetical protein
MEWFTVDRQGLAKILARKGIAHVILEPLSNAFDENVTRVDVTLKRIPGTRMANLVVTDDSPDGFADLSHTHRLFAPSRKVAQAELRGRYNAGDKMLLAMCESATITSTTGTMVFDKSGRHSKRAKTERGSIFDCTLRLTNEQIDECHAVMSRIIPPVNVQTFYNGELLRSRVTVATIEATLQTETSDEDGYLRRRQRKTTVSIYEPLPGETPTLYELGIPVCETGDRHHVSIGQKVPLDIERTSVPSAYLTHVRALVLAATHSTLTAEDATSPWVREALHTHADTIPIDAIRQVTQLRFGPKAVAFDPSDPEANALAIAKGYRVISGGSMSGNEWAAVKRTGALLPAGQVTPSPKPYGDSGDPLKVVEPSKWTPEMKATVEYSRRIAKRLINREIAVTIASDVSWPFAATYGDGQLTYNLGRLGHKFFQGSLEAKNKLLIHELGHDAASNHLSSEYHDALTLLGAKLTQLALEEPELFQL